MKLLWSGALATLALSLPAGVGAQFITGWDKNGVPDDLIADYPVSTELIHDVELALPEGRDVRDAHPDQLASPDRTRITLTADADVYVTFLHEGSAFRSTLGCFLFFMCLGNFGLYLQLSGEADIISILNNESPTAAIFAILGALPMKYMVIGIYTVLAVIFTATTFDSISYILASVVQRKIEGEPMRWNRLFWAAALSFMPITLLFLGGDNGLATLQTASIVGGAPLLIVALLLCVAIVKVARHDIEAQPHIESNVTHIEKLPVEDPWAAPADGGPQSQQ